MRPVRRCTVLLTAILLGAGCGPEPRRAMPSPPPPAKYEAPPQRQAAAFPRDLSSEAMRAGIIEDVRERLMSHRDIERDASRITREVAPLVAEAARQPSVQEPLRQYAQDNGMSLEAARSQWADLQTADLMLESGGDPDALSSAAAAGVAQWLAGTAKGAGIPVALAASNRLTATITALRCRIAWIEYLQRPDADRSAPGAPLLGPGAAAELPKLRVELETLRAQRRRIDGRYEPRTAIFAQTRYLLRIYSRFPSAPWLFQAYHGGEAGVSKTLRLFLGPAWPGEAAGAIRNGWNGGALTYDRLFFNTTPQSHTEAFSYLYGRSDDHRHYWYKLLAARAVISAYKKSPRKFHAEWIASLPGRRVEAFWYPDATRLSIATLAALRQVGGLQRVQPQPDLVMRPARDDPANSAAYSVLQPPAYGLLRLVAASFQHDGAHGPLTAGDQTLPQEYVERARALHPPRPPVPPIFPPDPAADATVGGGPPRRFDYHTTGLVFDLVRPEEPWDRKVLAYTLDRLESTGLLAAIDAKDQDERRFHVVPNPRYARLLTGIASDPRTIPADL